MKERYLDKLGLSKGVKAAMWIAKGLTVLCIVGFLIMNRFVWYEMSGSAAAIGFDAVKGGAVSFETDQDILRRISPFGLWNYVRSHEGALIGQERLMMTAHSIMVLLQAVAWGLALLAAVGLLTGKYLEWIRMAKISSIIVMAIMGINLVQMRTANLNLWILQAARAIKGEYPLYGVNVAGNGIRMNDVFYSYQFVWTRHFLWGWGFLAAWFVMSAILTEVRRKWYYDRQDMEKE